MIYNVKFGSVWKDDQFNMTGEGTVEISDVKITLIGKRYPSMVLRIILTLALYWAARYVLESLLDFRLDNLILRSLFDLGVFLLFGLLVHVFVKKTAEVTIDPDRLIKVKRSGSTVIFKTPVNDRPNSSKRCVLRLLDDTQADMLEAELNAMLARSENK